MSPPARPADRREPLPGLFAMPGHLMRQLSPGARRVVGAAGVLLLAAVVVTAIVLGPRIADSNRERAAEQRADEQRAKAAESARLAREQRPRTGTLAPAAAAVAVAGLERAITRDARARVATGELNSPARRTDCRTLGREGGRLLLSCTAVTSDVDPTAEVPGVLIGYPYRGALSPATGSYGFCKTSGRPGEGSYTSGAPVELPRQCGG